MKNIIAKLYTRKPFCVFTILVLFLFVFCSSAKSQTTETFNSPGDSTFTVPAGVTSIVVECWGGGGAGGGSTSNMKGGSGGGGGGYTTAILKVTPGQSIPYTIGAGGIGINGKNGTSGSNSSFSGLIANGGVGGEADKGKVGDGGIGVNGTVIMTGGTGLVGFKAGGAGGDGAHGGVGGLQRENEPGYNGNIAGGGGGGGNAKPGDNNNVSGGNGANGQVSVTYLNSISGPSIVCSGSTTSLTNDTPEGTWQSSNTLIAIIDQTSGEVSGISGGTTEISYSVFKSSFKGDSLGNLTRSAMITVNPLPVINSASTGEICSGVAQNHTITSTVSGTTYNWSRAVVSGIIGSQSGQTTNPITEALINTTVVAKPVVYTITPSANGCPGTPFTYTVTVNPIPAVSSDPAGEICSGVAQNYTIASKVLDATFSWSRDSVTYISNEAVSGQTTNPITETLNNTTKFLVDAIYWITPIANGCPGTPFKYTVTVKPTPKIKDMSASICSGSVFSVSPVNGTDGIVPTGTKYSWPALVEDFRFSGGAADSSSTNITGTIINKTNSALILTYNVTARVGNKGCTGNTFPVTITVNPIAQIPDLSFEVFSGVPFDTVLINNRNGIIPEGTTYSWAGPTNPNISGGSSGSGANNFNGTLTNTTNKVQTAIYTVTPSTTSYQGNRFTITVTVDFNKWTGEKSSSWNNPANWSQNKILEEEANLVFSENPLHNCVMDSDYTVNDITIQSAHLLETKGHQLSLMGNLYLTNGGLIDASATGSIVKFNGLAAQNLPPKTFLGDIVYDLVINNEENVKLNGTLKVLNNLTANSGKLDAANNTPTVIYCGTAAQKIDSNPFLNKEVSFLTVDNDVTLNTDLTVIKNLIINREKRLTISAGSELNVKENIQNDAGMSGLLIRAGEGVANATLTFHNNYDSPVPATVEMFSQASKPDNNYKWQFFGIPLRTLEKASPTFDGSYVREMHENDNPFHWNPLKNNSSLTSFRGYEITQKTPKPIYFEGDLENKVFTSGKLSYTKGTTYPGQHLIGNPYTAAININKIIFGSIDEGIIKNTAYLYNTGSEADWSAEGSGTSSGYKAGQYIAVPIGNAGFNELPAQIPSMQAFLVRVAKDDELATVSIPYSAVETVVKNTEMQRAPVAGKVSTRIDVKGSRFSDRMWIFTEPGCTRGFDNGWDGEKILGSALAPQIYAMEDDGDYQVNTVDDINNTYLGFQVGEDLQDTLTFTHENLDTSYEGLYLLDLATNKAIDITQSGTKYVFSAEISKAAIKRFKIITNPVNNDSTDFTTGLRIFSSQETVFVHNLSNENGYVLFYDMSGRMLQKLSFGPGGVTSFPMSLTPGAYIVKALTSKEEITKRLVLPQTEK